MAILKQTQKELKRTSPGDRAFFSMFESHSTIMLLIEPWTGIILDANPAALNYYGYPHLIGMAIFDINTLPSEQLALDFQKALNNTQTYFVFKHRLANGEERRVEVNSSSLTIQGRQVLFLIIHDITSREQNKNGPNKDVRILTEDEIIQYELAQENLRIFPVELEMQNYELRHSQVQLEAMRARYFDLYDLAPVGYCTLTPEGRILESNLTAARLFGVTRVGLVGNPLHRFILREDQDIFYLFRKRLFETGSPQNCELRMLNTHYPAGQAWVLLEASLSQGRQDTPEVWIAISDISDRKLAEADVVEREATKREQAVLAKADAERRLLLDNIEIQVWYMTDDHTYGIVNAAHAAFIGVSKESLDSRSLYDFVPNKIVDHYIQYVKQVFSTGQPIRSELSLPNAAGEWRLLNILTSPITNAGGLVQQVVCSADDITERKLAEEALQQSEQRYRIVVEWSPYAIVVHRDGKIIYVNPAAIRFFGANSAQDLVGNQIFDRIQPNFHTTVRERLKKSVDEGVGAPLAELKYIRLDGSIVEAEAQGIPILYDGVPAIYAILADISERKQAEEALHYAHWRLESTIEGTHVGTWEWNVQTGETTFNEIWAQIIGCSLSELTPTSIKTWEMLAHPDDLQQSDELLERHFSGELSYYDCEMRIKHKDGHWVWIQDRGKVITWTADGKPLLMFGTHSDISLRKTSEEKIRILNIALEKLAMTDVLTNLFNRRYFMQRGIEAVKHVLRNAEPLTLLMLDIDFFKKVNDDFGHDVGDLALQHVAAVLKFSLREIDILARIGGEEFAVLLPNTGQDDGVAVAERIRKFIEQTAFKTSGKELSITVSIGAAVFEVGMPAIDDLLRNADLALYEAKHRGRNCVVLFQKNTSPQLEMHKEWQK